MFSGAGARHSSAVDSATTCDGVRCSVGAGSSSATWAETMTGTSKRTNHEGRIMLRRVIMMAQSLTPPTQPAASGTQLSRVGQFSFVPLEVRTTDGPEESQCPIASPRRLPYVMDSAC